MTRPLVHPSAEQSYRLLPDFMRAADEPTDYTALKVTAAGSVAMEKALDFLTIVDPATSVTGTCELVNAAACPRPYLPWLGWLIGIDTTQIADQFVRDALLNASTAQRRGTVGAIRDVVERTLTGSRYCRVYSNLGGANPYRITVITLTSETPDTGETLAAAEGEKPAGMEIELQTVAGSVWNTVVAEYDTWSDVTAAQDTWNDLTTWLP